MAMSEPQTCSRAFGGTIQPEGFDYKIVNASTTPYVVLRLHPDQKIIAENGALMKKTSHITSDMGVGNGKEQSLMGKLGSAISRKLAGEGFLSQHFTNTARETQDLVLAAPHPGQILAVNLPDYDRELVCQRGAFMAAPSGTDVTFHIRQKLGFMAFGREEFVMQKIKGDDVVFLHVGGGIYCEDLKAGEDIQVDTGCFVAATKDVQVGITRAGSLMSMVLGEEGLVLVNCKGPGKVWMQSMPYARQVAQITAEQKIQGKPGLFGADKR